MRAEALAALIRTVPDFPKPGIQFRDISPLLADPSGLAGAVSLLADRVADDGATLVAGMEARGFIFGAAVAARLGIGFVPLRKPGKLPVETLGVDYALEYGTARLELDPTVMPQGGTVALVDDLIATGGTALAAAQLVRQAGGSLTGAHFLIDLPDLGGARALREQGVATSAILAYAGD